MSENNSSLPPIVQGDPSDLRTKRIGEEASAISGRLQPVNQGLTPEAPSKPRSMERLLPSTGGTIIPGDIQGTSPWYNIFSPSSYGAVFTGDYSPRGQMQLGANIADPRVNPQFPNILLRQMEEYATTGDKLFTSITGGLAQGVNALGADIAGLLGGSFWSSDFERTALEEYFAAGGKTIDAVASRGIGEELGFYKGLQAAVSSITEFAPLGGMVNVGVKGVGSGIKAVAKGVKQSKTAAEAGKKINQATKGADAAKKGERSTNVSFEGIEGPGIYNTTRVSEKIASQGKTLADSFLKRSQQFLSTGAATAIPAGLIQNRFEGTAMALETYEEILNELEEAVNAGEMSQSEAELIAAENAELVRVHNFYYNSMQDVFQHAFLFRAKGLTRNGYVRPGRTWNPRTYLKNATASKEALMAYGSSNFIVQGLGEMGEEILQYNIQQESKRNAVLGARDIISSRGGDTSFVQPESLKTAVKSGLVARAIDYSTSKDALFEGAIGFFAGAGQRALVSSIESYKDSKKYKKLTAEIEKLKRKPAITPQDEVIKNRRVAELEAQRAMETLKGRYEAFEGLKKTLEQDVKDSVQFAIESDDLISMLDDQKLQHFAEGIEKKAFFQLFLKHAINGTVDHLERYLGDVANGSITSDIFPQDGSAKTKAAELMKELTRLEADYISTLGFEGQQQILSLQESRSINSNIFDAAIKARSEAQTELEGVIKKTARSVANVSIDMETGDIVVTDKNGKEIKPSKALQTAMETSEDYINIFGEGGFNDQLDALSDAIVNIGEQLDHLISPEGQRKLKSERQALEEQLAAMKKVAKARKGGKTKTERDTNNVNQANARTKARRDSENDNKVKSEVVRERPPQEGSPEKDPFNNVLPNEKAVVVEDNPALAGERTIEEEQALAEERHSVDALDTDEVTNEFGYARAKISSLNRIASLQLEYVAKILNGTITLQDVGLNNIASYVALSDPDAISEGTKITFKVNTNEETLTLDPSDIGPDKQGTKKTVKEARERAKQIAEHESKLSGETVTEEQVVRDTEAIEIWATQPDGSDVLLGYVHTPQYEREARKDSAVTPEEIAEFKRNLRAFRNSILNGKVTESTIEHIKTPFLNYIEKSKRKSTAETFKGVPKEKFKIAVATSSGLIFEQNENQARALGKKSTIVNKDSVIPGMSYVVVPIKKNNEGVTHYYAAPLTTSKLNSIQVNTIMNAFEAWLHYDEHNIVSNDLQINLKGNDVTGLEILLKRFIRIYSTGNIPSKPNSSFVYRKTVTNPTTGKEEKILVFRKNTDSSEAFLEIEIKRNKLYSNEDKNILKTILEDQYTNVNLDEFKNDSKFKYIVYKADGSVSTSPTSYVQHLMNITNSSIAPLRTEDGNLAGDRAVFHYNPDVRFAAALKQESRTAEPVVKPETPPAPTTQTDIDAKKAQIEEINKERKEALKLLSPSELVKLAFQRGIISQKSWDDVASSDPIRVLNSWEIYTTREGQPYDSFVYDHYQKTRAKTFDNDSAKVSQVNKGIEEKYNNRINEVNKKYDSSETTSKKDEVDTIEDIFNTADSIKNSSEYDDTDPSGLVPETAIPTSTERAEELRVQGLTLMQQQQVTDYLLGRLVTSLAIINNTRVNITAEEAFNEAKDNAYNSIVAKFKDHAEGFKQREEFLKKQLNRFAKDPNNLDRLNKAIEDSNKKSKSAAEKAEVLEKNKDKIMEQVLSQFEQLAGVTKRTASPQTTPTTGEEQEAEKTYLKGLSKIFNVLGYDTSEDVEEDEGKSAPGLSKSYHSDDFYFTIDPVSSTSDRLRRALMNLPILDSEGNVQKNFFGESVYADTQDTFRRLHALLDGTKPIFKEQMQVLMQKYVDEPSLQNTSNWIPALVLNSMFLADITSTTVGTQFIEAAFSADPAIRKQQIQAITNSPIQKEVKNEFASNMAMHKLTAPMVEISTVGGNVRVKVFEQNRNTLINIVKQETYLNVKNKLYVYDEATGDYIPDREAITAALDLLNGYKFKGVPESSEQFRREFDAALGVNFSQETVDFFYNTGIKLGGVKTKPTKITDQKVWGQSNTSPFVILINNFDSIVNSNIPFSAKNPIREGAFDKLLKVEANMSKKRRIANTFIAGDRTISTFTANKYFNTQLSDIFEDIDRLENTVFTGRSLWLDLISGNEISQEDMEVQYLNFDPLKVNGEKESGDFNNLKEQQHALVKNALLTHSTQEGASKYKGFTLRHATFVPLTFSDKDTVLAVKGMALMMKFDELGNISDDVVNLFYENVVKAEIDRIQLTSRYSKELADDNNKTELNNDQLERGGGYFYLLPSLNEVKVTVASEEGNQEVFLNDLVQDLVTEEQMAEYEEIIKAETKKVLNALIEEKLEAFNSKVEDYNGISKDFKEYLIKKHKENNSNIKTPSAEVLKKMVAADIALNQALGTANVIQLFVGDPALYFKPSKIKQEEGTEITRSQFIQAAINGTYDNLTKRLASLIAPGIEPSRISDEEDYIQLMVEDIKGGYGKEFLRGLDPGAQQALSSGINTTDAQEFITWKEYIDVGYAYGTISEVDFKELNKVLAEETPLENMTKAQKALLRKHLFSAQKPVSVADTFTKIGEKYVRMRSYIKTSAIPLIPQFTKGTKLDNLRKSMETLQEKKGKNVRLTFESGVKVGFPSSSMGVSITNKNGDIKSVEELDKLFDPEITDGGDILQPPYTVIPRKYWRIQMAVPNKLKDESTKGTQVDKIVTSAAALIPSLQAAANDFSDISGKLFQQRVNELAEELLEESSIPGQGKVVNRKKLATILKKVAQDRNFDFNVLEGIQLNSKGEFIIPPSLSPASPQFQAMISAIIRKGVVKKKVTGGSQVLMSEALFQFQEGIEGYNDVIWSDSWTGKLLPMRLSEDGKSALPAQIIVSNRFTTPGGKKIDISKYTIKKDGRTFLDTTKVPKEVLEGFSFRIPTQGYNSMAYVEIVGFLPEYMGDIVIAPMSFITQMGSDFDVDKLYNYFYKLKEVDGKVEKVSSDEDSEYGYQNRLLDIRNTFLKHPEVFKLVTKPLDFGLHKLDNTEYKNSYDETMSKEVTLYGGLANAIAAKREAQQGLVSILSDQYQKGKYLEARAALDAVGVKATLNSFIGILNSHQKEITLTNSFDFGKEISINSIKGAQTLKRQRQGETDRSYTGRYKQDVTSGILSAAVDNQKEQIINKINLNNVTFNVSDIMELMGIEEDVIYTFLELEDIKDLVKEVSEDKFLTINNALDAKIFGLLTDGLSSSEKGRLTTKELNALREAAVEEFENTFGKMTQEQLASAFYNAIGNRDVFNKQQRAALLMKFTELNSIMTEIRPAVRLLSIDSKGLGTNIIEFLEIAERAKELEESSYVDTRSLLWLFGDYKIASSPKDTAKLLEKGYEKGPRLVSGQLMIKPDSAPSHASFKAFNLADIILNSEFYNMLSIIEYTSNISFIKSSRNVKKIIEKSVRGYINSNPDLFGGVTRQLLLFPEEGKLTTAEKIREAKQIPLFVNNPLIQGIEVKIEEGKPHVVEYRNSAGEDMVQDKEAKAFLEMLTSPRQEVIPEIGLTQKELARELIDYAFLTGGVKNAIDLVRYVPTSYLIDLGFYDILNEGFNTLINSKGSLYTSFMEQLMQHNPNIVNFVKTDKNLLFDSKKSSQQEVIYNPTENFKDQAGIVIMDNGLGHQVSPDYEYISTSINRERRVLKFIPEEGNYRVLDNLGTGTITEFNYGKAGFTDIDTNSTKFLYNRLTTPEQTSSGPIPPAPVHTDEDIPPWQSQDPFDDANFDEEAQPVQTELKAPPKPRSTAPLPVSNDPFANENIQVKGQPSVPAGGDPFANANILPIEEGPGVTSRGDNFIPDEDFFVSKRRSKRPVPPPHTDEDNPYSPHYVKAKPVRNKPQTVTGEIKDKVKTQEVVGIQGQKLVQLMKEIVDNATDPTHVYLADKLIQSGVLLSKTPKLLFKQGKIVDSNSTKDTAIIQFEDGVSDWNLENSILHELGHTLTLAEIKAYEQGRKMTPELQSAVKKLDTLRELFLDKLATKNPEYLINYAILTKQLDKTATLSEEELEKLQIEISTAYKAGDLKKIHSLLYPGYGANDLGEFVTLVMSSKDFRDLLDEIIDLDQDKTPKSLLDRVTEVLKEALNIILGLEPGRKISDYALEQAMFIATNSIDAKVSEKVSETVVTYNNKPYKFTGATGVIRKENGAIIVKPSQSLLAGAMLQYAQETGDILDVSTDSRKLFLIGSFKGNVVIDATVPGRFKEYGPKTDLYKSATDGTQDSATDVSTEPSVDDVFNALNTPPSSSETAGLVPNLVPFYSTNIASTIYELIPNISEAKIDEIYNNYVSLMGINRKGKEISKETFKTLLKNYQVFNYKDTYIFGNYDSQNGVFVTRINSSPSSRELLAEALPTLVREGVDFVSFVPKDVASKYERSGYSISTKGFDYNFKGEDMVKYLAVSNQSIPLKIFGKTLNELSNKEIEDYNNSLELKYTPVEIKGELIEKAGKDVSKIFEVYLSQFGIKVKDISEIKDALEIDELGVADILSKIAYVKNKKDLPPIAGEFIAYMMQYNPLVSDIIKELSQTESYKNLNKEQYFKIIGGLIADDLQNKLEGNYSKSLLDKLKQLIDKFFSLLRDTPVDLINKNIGIISNNVLQQNKRLITASLYKPGAFGKPTKQVSLEEAMSADKFGASIINNLSKKGFILTGSTSLGEQGTIQRPNKNLLHDIDWVSPFNRKQTEEIFKEVYPEAIKIRDIYGEGYITDTWIISPEGYNIVNLKKESDYNIITQYDIVDNKGSVVGTYRIQKQKDSNQKEEVVTGIEAKVIDFFSYEEYNQLSPFEKDGIKLVNWKEIFKAKLEFARYKDIWDYNRFIPRETQLEVDAEQKQSELGSPLVQEFVPIEGSIEDFLLSFDPDTRKFVRKLMEENKIQLTCKLR